MQPYQPPNKQAEILKAALKDADMEKKNSPKQPVKPEADTKNIPADKDKKNNPGKTPGSAEGERTVVDGSQTDPKGTGKSPPGKGSKP